ncbi:MAG: hypothetical protein LAO22_11280 [Acidobacteriia bacterium]|nr:hypothetical protein [Terriglobia bacterium]
MAIKSARWIVILLAVVLMLAAPSAIYSCGPFFDEAEFVRGNAPQVSQADFAAGKLGIVLPTLRRSYLIVAYRYLSGLKLDGKQQHEAIDVWNRNMDPGRERGENAAIEAWLKARGEVPGSPEIRMYETYAPVSNEHSYQSFLNCPDEAFKSAAATLADRIHKYGADSAVVRGWIAAQDQVFSNCNGQGQVAPAILDSKDPVVRADRDYQIATAHFYGRRFDDAAASFDAIAKDSASPWAPYGSYLAARALIRKATLDTPEEDKFDGPTMKAAQQRLEQLLSDPHAAVTHDAAQRLLDFVRFRAEPAKRIAEMEQLMLKPDPGTAFKQHLWDYVLLLAHGEQAEDLSDWVRTIYTESTYEQPSGVARSDAGSAAEHAVAKWRETRSLPWLIAALQLTGAEGNAAGDLLKAASQVPASSPGFLTVRYYALRMMAKGKQPDAARKELDALLGRPAADLPLGARNLLNDERQRLATSLADFLAHAAEIPTYVGFDVGLTAGGDEQYESEQAKQSKGRPFFNAYAAQLLAQRMPLTLLVESARSSALPNHLRREIARSAWMRAVLVGDMTAADQLQPLLQELDSPLWKMMEPFRTAKAKEEKSFAAILLTLQNPGLSPFVRTGLLRSATLGEMDHFRDNWWCEASGDDVVRFRRERGSEVPSPTFLSAEDQKALQKEMAKLVQAPVAPNYLVPEVLAYAKQNPDDPRVPEALHLAVRSTRWGCTNPETTHWSEKAFRLVHQRYPKSEWAEKTKYHY